MQSSAQMPIRESGLKALLRPLVRRVRGFKTVRGIVGERRWRRWEAGVALEPELIRGGRLLEIGCASGDRLFHLHEAGWRDLHGIELVAAAAARAADRGFDVLCAPIEDAIDRYPDGHFDVIIASMVLEHLVDPFNLVETIARKLKPRGQFLFSTVVRDSLDGWLFGAFWSGFDFPRHLVYFSRKDLSRLLTPEFEAVQSFHQSAPIDFIRSATWRNRGSFDRTLLRLFSSERGRSLTLLLAWFGLTCRVSITAKKSAESPRLSTERRDEPRVFQDTRT